MAISMPDVLQTKLIVPPARTELISRPRLMEQLNTGLSRPLTLICAPAGFGKTTLLSAWILSQISTAFPVAWLSLDEDDNDTERFLSYLIASLASIDAMDEGDLLSLLKSNQAPPKAIITALIRRVEMFSQPFILVLDDYHLLTHRSIHETVTFLIEHLPPHMHLIITSREDPPLPLARLRAHDRLVEIRAEDLRLTLQEAKQFLAQVLGISLTHDQVKNLEARTEGWIAGLQLAALAMKGRDDVSGFIAAFTGSHRFILDYLTEEVLNRQTEELQNFLLQTSILNRLCGPLCDAVTQSTDGQLTLELIERSNLFLISLDDERYWYRYHHLFGAILGRHLHQRFPNLVLELHRRASYWFVGENLIEEAVNHALLSKDFDLAATIMEGPGNHYFGEMRIGVGLKWPQLLPEAVIACHPRLLLNLALWNINAGQYDIAQKYVQDARNALSSSDKPPAELHELNAYADVIDASYLIYHGRAEQSRELAEQALNALPDYSLYFRYTANTLIGVTNRLRGNLTESENAFTRNIAIAHQLHDIAMLGRAMVHIAESIWLLDGRLEDGLAVCYEALAIANDWKQAHLPGIGLIYLVISVQYLEQNRLEEAITFVLNSLNCMEQILPHYTFIAYLVLTRAYQCVGAHDEMLSTAHKLDTLLKAFPGLPQIRFNLYRMHGWLLREIVDLERYLTHDGTKEDFLSTYIPYTTQLIVIRSQIAADANTLEPALGELEQMQADFEEKRMCTCLLDVLILKALMLNLLHRYAEAEQTLTQALVLAEPGGFVRIFVDEGEPMAHLLRRIRTKSEQPRYVDYLLTLMEQPMSAQNGIALRVPQTGDIEALSERELEVLRLIAEGASNREIAETLYISIGTVKKHLNNIFLKFDAHSRTQAVAVARQYNLL